MHEGFAINPPRWDAGSYSHDLIRNETRSDKEAGVGKRNILIDDVITRTWIQRQRSDLFLAQTMQRA